MNREDIIRMAEEAGFKHTKFEEGYSYFSDELGDLTRFAQLVAAHEREACKALCVCGYVSCDRP